jgi:signal transduction histidine kinase
MSLYNLVPLVAFLFNIVLIFIVLRRDWTSFLHRIFSLFLFVLALWALGIFEMRTSLDLAHAFLWEKVVIVVGPSASVLFFHFTLLLTRAKRIKGLLPAAYAVIFAFVPFSISGFVVRGMQLKPYGYAPILGPLFYPWILCIYFFLVMGAYNLLKTRKRLSAEERNRSDYITAGVGCYLLGGITDVLPVIGIPMYPLGMIGNIIFCLLATIAILRHHLLDIHIAVRKGTAYFIMSALVAIPYVGIIFLFTRVFRTQAIPIWVYFTILAILALSLQPLWSQVQRRVDKWFYRERYDYLKALETFSQQTQSLTDFAKLGSTMVNLIAKALRSSNVCLLQPLPHSHDFTMAFSTGMNNPTTVISLKRQGAIVKWLEHSGSMLAYEDIEIIPQLQAITSKERQALQQVRAELIVPLKSPTGQLSGVLILAKKLSERPYTIEDKQLIYAISSQAVINLENARLYTESQQELRERKRAEEELEQSREQLRDLSAHIESAREMERTSIAREVHDELGQALTALKMDLSWLNKKLPREQEALIKKIREMSELIGKTIQTVKRISTELRPGVLDDLGLMAAVEWQMQEFQERTQIKCEFTAKDEDINVDRDLATGIFRIFQEALTNVARHANATKVKVSLKERDGQLVLQVSDNGRGITAKQIVHPKSFGLIGMRERARSWNGSVKIEGISGKRTIVTVSIPLNQKEERDDKNTSS